MIAHLLNNTRTMTERLAAFFGLLSLLIGLFCLIVITAALYWSEDRVSERRIKIDAQEAIELFRENNNVGKIQIDRLTVAYNRLSSVPRSVLTHLDGKSEFIGEVGDDPDSNMIYLTHYSNRGQTYPLVLVSHVDRVEISQFEFVFVVAIVLCVVTLLIISLGSLLYRISHTLIEPINQLHQQLIEHAGDTSRPFKVSPTSANEFHILADKLNQYRDEAHQLVEREKAFARYASHELRTPLTIIQGSNGLLQRSSNNAFTERQVARIGQASQQMSDIIEALLHLVRYEHERTHSESIVINEAVLIEIIHRDQPQAKDKNLVIHANVISELTLNASLSAFTMVVSNLLRNAIAATSHGVIEIELSNTTLSIKDSGHGYDCAAFNQAGHGIGLPIVKEWCHRFGWRFSIKNRDEGGAIATIEFVPS